MPEVSTAMSDLRIIFLDIDGVLNNPGTYAPTAPWRGELDRIIRVPIAPECMQRLNTLTDATGAKVVISSSWRSAWPTPRSEL